jgi:hypothetical protein
VGIVLAVFLRSPRAGEQGGPVEEEHEYAGSAPARADSP